MDGQTDGRTDGQTDGQTDRQSDLIRVPFILKKYGTLKIEIHIDVNYI